MFRLVGEVFVFKRTSFGFWQYRKTDLARACMIPIWRASMIAALLMLGVILFIDGLAHARILDYQTNLLQAQRQFSGASAD